MRVAQITDPHLTEGPRFVDTRRCVEWGIADAIANDAGLFAWTGDFAGTTDLSHRPTTLEQNTWDILLQRCANHAPTILLYGNHDGAHTLDGYGRLAAKHPIIVVDEPRVIELEDARVFCLPYPWKRDWIARFTGSIAERDHAVEGAVRELLEGWRPQVDEARRGGRATIFLGHVAIGGAALAGGETLLPGQEIEVSVGDLRALGCDYSGSGHLHLCQEMAEGIWHAGSISRSNFGELDPKGYLLVDVRPGQPPLATRRLSPARRFLVVNATWAQTPDGTWGWERDAVDPAALEGSEVQLRVEVPEEAAATCPTEELKAEFAQVAVAVDMKREVIRPIRVRCEAIRTARSTPEKILVWFDSLGESGPSAEQRARCLEKYAQLKAGAPAQAA